MIVNVLGRRIRVETLPPPARPRLRWDGSPQAYPATPIARAAHAVRLFGYAIAELSTPPRHRQPDYLARHLR